MLHYLAVDVLTVGSNVTRSGDISPIGLLFTRVGKKVALFLGYLQRRFLFELLLVKFGQTIDT